MLRTTAKEPDSMVVAGIAPEAASRSLASLEVIAHHSHIPDLYQIIAVEVPDDLAVESVDSAAQLPRGWQTNEASTAAVGTEWADSLRTPVLRVPSAIFPDEWNYVLNPLHADFARITFTITGERIDPRLYAS
jgi:RES domain-containing protein